MSHKIYAIAIGCAFLIGCSDTSTSPSNPNTSSGTALSSSPLSSTLSSATVMSSSSGNLGTSSIASAGNVLFDGSLVDEYGLVGKGVIAPDADGTNGGTSTVLGSGNTILGPCPSDKSDCIPEWNIGSALNEGAVSSSLSIKAWVPSSAKAWGWASAGWMFLPNTPTQPASGQTWIDVASPMGLTPTSTLVLDLSYTAGSTLTIELKSSETTAATADGASAPPRYKYIGKGSREVIRIPVTSIKPDSWSAVKSYDATKYNALLLSRIVAAGATGQTFPSAEASKITELKVWSIKAE
jgi:hypothetical protein